MQERLKRTYGNPNCLSRFSHIKSLDAAYSQPVAIPFKKEDAASTPFSPIEALSPLDTPLPGVSMNDFSVLFSEVDDAMPGVFDDYYNHGRLFLPLPILEGFFSDALFPSLQTYSQMGGYSDPLLNTSPIEGLSPRLPSIKQHIPQLMRNDEVDISLLSLDLNDPSPAPSTNASSQVQRRRVLVETCPDDSVVFVKNGKVVHPSCGTQRLDALVGCGPPHLKPRMVVHEDTAEEVSFYQKNALVGCVSVATSNPEKAANSESVVISEGVAPSESVANPEQAASSESAANPESAASSEKAATSTPTTLMTVDVRSIDREQLQPFTVKEGAAQGRYTLDTAELNKLSSRYASVVSDVTLPEVQGVPQMAQREGRTAEAGGRREVGRGIRDDGDAG